MTPSGSPYKIYIGNVTFTDGNRTKDEGWERVARRRASSRDHQLHRCAFPEVITEWQRLEGNPFLSSERTVRRKMFLYWEHVMTARK